MLSTLLEPIGEVRRHPLPPTRGQEDRITQHPIMSIFQEERTTREANQDGIIPGAGMHNTPGTTQHLGFDIFLGQSREARAQLLIGALATPRWIRLQVPDCDTLPALQVDIPEIGRASCRERV